MRQFRKGYPFLSYQGKLVPLPCDVDVFYDPPRPTLPSNHGPSPPTAESPDPPAPLLAAVAFKQTKRPRLRMQCSGRLAGIDCHILIDTGCTEAFVSASFARANKLAFVPQDLYATLEGGSSLHILGTCKLWLKISAYQTQVRFKKFFLIGVTC